MQVMAIAPYESFGPARFGSSEEEVVTAMGQPDYALEKKYSYGHFKVHFDVYGCDCAELFSSRDEVVPLVDSDLRLVGEFDVVVQALHQRGYETRPGPHYRPNVVWDVVCDALGIRLWHATEEIIGIESVAAFRRDVYQRMFQPQ